MKTRRFKESLSFALAGIGYTWKTQRNFRIHIMFGSFAVVASLLLKVSYVEVLFIAAAIFFVLVMELLNTALEATVDLITKEYHPLACIAKNIGAAAVLLSALFALFVGVTIFGRRIVNFF